MRLLPMLRPCTESFDAMPGDERTRFCEKCQKHVYNLSARTEEEARDVFARTPGERVCVRYARNAAGAILFAAAVTACSSAVPSAPPPTTPADQVEVEMGDAIPDAVDKCPDQPGPNDQGCPEK